MAGPGHILSLATTFPFLAAGSRAWITGLSACSSLGPYTVIINPAESNTRLARMISKASKCRCKAASLDHVGGQECRFSSRSFATLVLPLTKLEYSCICPKVGWYLDGLEKHPGIQCESEGLQENGGGETAIQTAILRAQERMLAADVEATRNEQRAAAEASPATGTRRTDVALADLYDAMEQGSGGEEDIQVPLPSNPLPYPKFVASNYRQWVPAMRIAPNARYVKEAPNCCTCRTESYQS